MLVRHTLSLHSNGLDSYSTSTSYLGRDGPCKVAVLHDLNWLSWVEEVFSGDL